MHGRQEISEDTLKDAVATAITEQLKNTKFEDMSAELTNAINAIKSMGFNRFTSKGYIGIDYTDEDTETPGESRNLSGWQAAYKDILQGLGQIDVAKIKDAFDAVREPMLKSLEDIKRKETITKNRIAEVQKTINRNTLEIGKLDNYFKNSQKQTTKLKADLEKNQKALNTAYKKQDELDAIR